VLADPDKKLLVNAVAFQLHTGQYFAGAKIVSDWLKGQSGHALPVATKKEADEVLTLLLHWCLNNGGFEEAAQLLWGPTLFDPRPDSTRRVWSAFEKHKLILLMGAGSMSKSYSMGVRLFLEWVRDPEYTTIQVVGPSEKHLEMNLFTHLVSLHQQSSIPLPGGVGKLFIGLDPRNRKSSISGVVVPLGTSKAGKLQGTKRINRKTEHPIFGKTSRMFIFLDEIANIPKGIWRDLDNLMTGMGEGDQKIIGAFNPTELHDEVGVRCEPAGGWQLFDPEEDYEWVSARGWFVVRLDAMKCENVIEKRVIYPGLQTWEGFQILLRNAGGVDSPGYWSMGRGCFPPMGVPMSVIPQGLLANLKANVVWYDKPTPCGGADLALEGSDTAVFAKGLFGLASGIKLLPSLAHPDGQTIMFKNAARKNAPRHLLLAETLLHLPKGDTVAMKNEVLRILRSFSIKPEWFAIDRTGNGQGVVDLLHYEYGEVIGVNFNEACSATRVMEEDHAVPAELYARLNTEMMFALRKFIEFGYLKLSTSLSTDSLYPQLTGRRYKARGKLSAIESKPDYASRNQGKSPDEADALCLLVLAARRGSGVTFTMTGELSSDRNPTGGEDEGDYEDRRNVRISADNRVEDL
jgi:hypothetical protein